MDLSFTYYMTFNNKQFKIRCFVYFTQIDHIYQAPTLSPSWTQARKLSFPSELGSTGSSVGTKDKPNAS